MPEEIAVLGLGYVGCVSAACLARLGHRVIGVDRDEFKVHSVNEGRAPFFEPGLAPLIEEGVRSGNLSATTDLLQAMLHADVAYVCVGTPSERNGNLGTGQLQRVISEIAQTLAGRTKNLIVAIRSTVFPGTCDELVVPLFQNDSRVRLVCNPEFLREGMAVRDFLEPSLLVAGSADRDAAIRIAGLYQDLHTEPCLVSLRTAEMIKYACNSFHAVKVSFANEVGALCGHLAIDGQEVMATLCKDHRLNISPAYLKPGFAFGGSCLPKDLRALTFRAGRLDLRLPLLEAALPSNAEHLRRSIERVLDLGPVRLGIIGLAFKENTDDLRESPVVSLLEHLIGKGRQVRIWDPHIQLESIYGSNRNFILEQIPHIGRLLHRSLGDMLAWAGHVIVAQRATAEILAQVQASGLPVTDLTT